MHFKRKNKSKSKVKYELACSEGYCPTINERENSAIKQLANRLEAVSDKETLTNVLEWQDRNIVFWFERYPLSHILLVSIVFFVVSLPILYFLRLWWLVAVLGTIPVTTLAIMMLIFYNVRKIPLKELWKVLWNVIKPNNPVNWVLEKKLCVCRDYAKLTACLLLNIYPDAEVYFAHAPSHVATGIMIEQRLYVLDKYLPVATIEKWHERWHKGKHSDRRVERVKGYGLESVDLNSFLSETATAELNTEKLAVEMTKLLKIKEPTADSEVSSLNLPRWKKGAVLYEDNEIVNYSLARLLKRKICCEMLELGQITRIGIDRNKDDLNFRVTFKSNM